MQPHIIALTGMPGAGKDLLLKFIGELELAVEIVRPKEFVKKEMQGQALLTDFSNARKIPEDSIENRSAIFLAKKIPKEFSLVSAPSQASLGLGVKKFASVYMGKAIKDRMQEENVPITSESVREFATNLRKAMGYDIVAKLCVPAIEQSIQSGRVVIIEDIKGWDEVKFFRKHFGTDFALIAIHTPPHIRFQRAQSRGDEWDKKRVGTKDEFDFRDEKELGWGLGNAVAMADYVIVNDGTLEEFKGRVEGLFRKLL